MRRLAEIFILRRIDRRHAVRQWHASSLSETFTQQYVAFNGRAAQSRLDFKRRATCLARYTLPSLELILQSSRQGPAGFPVVGLPINSIFMQLICVLSGHRRDLRYFPARRAAEARSNRGTVTRVAHPGAPSALWTDSRFRSASLRRTSGPLDGAKK